MCIDFWRQNTWKLLHEKWNNGNKVVAESNASGAAKTNQKNTLLPDQFLDMFPLQVKMLTLVVKV